MVVSGGCEPLPLHILGVNTEPREPDDDVSAPARGLAIAASGDAVRTDPELSAAARAFKRCALTALGLSESVGATEAFRGRTRLRAGYSDLMRSATSSLAQR